VDVARFSHIDSLNLETQNSRPQCAALIRIPSRFTQVVATGQCAFQARRPSRNVHWRSIINYAAIRLNSG
jgi:hypothetical protein